MPLVLQLLVLTMLMVVGAGLMHVFLGPWDTLLRTSLVALGFCVMMWARGRFTARKTILFAGQISSHLVCDDPFRFSRTPMYAGVLVSLVGLAVWVGTLPLYMTVPSAFVFFHVAHIPCEEEMLRNVFGTRYLAYAKEVRRWL